MQQLSGGESRVPTLAQVWIDYQKSRHLKETTTRNYDKRLRNHVKDWLLLPVDQIGIADKLDLDPQSRLGLEGQAAVPDAVVVLQLSEGDLGGVGALEGADFPEFSAEKFFL